MDILKKIALEKASGESKPGSEALAGKKLVGIYFSAHWCPPCRGFTPVLKDFYEALLEAGKDVEIVFVSSDKSADEMRAYMKESHGDWYAVPHGSAAAKELSSLFHVSGIPTLVFLTEDGTVAERDGRGLVQRGPPSAVYDQLAK